MIVSILSIFIGIYFIGNLLFTFWVLEQYTKSENKEVPIKTMTIYAMMFGSFYALYLGLLKLLK